MADQTRSPRERSWISRTMRRLVADDADLDAEELQSDVEQVGATSVSRCCRGEEVTITGRLKSVIFKPRETVPTLEAELFDGSGTVTLIWMGRRQITGIEPGRAIVARGRLAEKDGSRLLFNPWYELKQNSS